MTLIGPVILQPAENDWDGKSVRWTHVLSSPAALQGYQFDKIERNRQPNRRSLVLVHLQPQKN